MSEWIYPYQVEQTNPNFTVDHANSLQHHPQQQNRENEQRQQKLTACVGLNVSSKTAQNLVKTMRTTIGTMAQKLRRSTRRRQPLIDSPSCTPRGGIGKKYGDRTPPTSLYSPFGIETPRGKENQPGKRMQRDRPSVRRKVEVDAIPEPASPRLMADLHRTQVSVYEFHHVANRILKNRISD